MSYTVQIGKSPSAGPFGSLKAARTYVAGHLRQWYEIHKSGKLVESGKVHPATPGTGGRVWLVKNPSTADLTDHQKQIRARRRRICDLCGSATAPTGGGIMKGGAPRRVALGDYSRICARCVLRGATGGDVVKRNPDAGDNAYSIYSDDGFIRDGIQTLAEAKKIAKRLAIDQNTYVYSPGGKLHATFKMKYPKSRNPRAKTDVAFTVDKNGKPVAYNMHGRGGWQVQGRMIGGSPVRMNWDEAKLWVATGQADQVAYRSDADDRRTAAQPPGYQHRATINPQGSAVGYIQPKSGKGRKIAVYAQASGKLIAGGERYADMNDLLNHIDSRWTYVARNPLPVDRWVKVKARRLPNGRIELRGNR